ncbi:MAG TPA: 3-oxoacyl-ACP reductase family protein [Terriglobales bacterium]|nr:3-oxoacyl-ACP reductase family protein [Terriglobales bacterium]
MSQNLSGKIAMVTGASRGLGAAIAKRLAADGAAVAFTYGASPDRAREVVRAIETAGGKALAIQADAAKEDSTRAAVKQTIEAFGGLDILVNSAGVLTVAPIEKFPFDAFERMVAVNIKGMFVATQEAVRHMRDGGRIINIGSCNSSRVPFQGGTVYALTKAAVVGFTRALARDLGPRGITVNNVQPGPTDTDMNPAQGPAAPSTVQHVALGRFAQPLEIANFVAFLAGPEASFITGASLLVDGGYAA